MKKVFFILSLFLSLSAFSQEKKDTTFQITLSIDQFRQVLFVIDQNVDSKKVSKELIEFLQKSAQMVANKPKELKTKN